MTTGTLKRFCLTMNSLTPASITGADHVVGVLQPQRHRLFDHDMLSGPGAGNDMRGVHSARRQNRNRVDILPRQKIIDVVAGRNAELRGDGVGARANRIADGNETGPLDMTTAQQLGMTLRDASTSEQAKSDHHSFLCGGRQSPEKSEGPWRASPV